MKTSSYSGFFKLSMEERLKEVAEFPDLQMKSRLCWDRPILWTMKKPTT